MEISKPYGEFMRAPFKRHVKPIGAKWLRNGIVTNGTSAGSGSSQAHAGDTRSNQDPQNAHANQSSGMERGKSGKQVFPTDHVGGITGLNGPYPNNPTILPVIVRKENSIIDNKKRKTDGASDISENLGPSTELMDSDDGPNNNDNTSSKNGQEESTPESTRLGL
ncbi:hypothetical protein POM88_023145 [Heracleum sosnowskyi]|uniref:Uncharacterized protein n=1 Tax=Heracleum sosnowskyi TaxID=360622 RepID=A0AAD8MQ85_9APIA|nr:hypothetical protein POM88_023145 [Heracleum sosnowskyi]